jgi:hypothetical protein
MRITASRASISHPKELLCMAPELPTWGSHNKTQVMFDLLPKLISHIDLGFGSVEPVAISCRLLTASTTLPLMRVTRKPMERPVLQDTTRTRRPSPDDGCANEGELTTAQDL